MKTLFAIAFRNLRRNRRRTAITLAALILGVGVTVLIQGWINGLQSGIVDQAVSGFAGAVQVHRAGYLKDVLSTPLSLDFAVDDALLARIRAVDGATGAAPRLAFAGMLSTGEQTVFFSATGIDAARERVVCPKRSSTFGDGATLDGPTDVVLARDLLTAIGSDVHGDAVLLAPDHDGALNGENVVLAGTLRGASVGDAKVGLVALPLAQRLLRMEGRATEIAVSVDRLERAPDVAARLRAVLGPDFEVHTWDQVYPSIPESMKRRETMIAMICNVFMVLMLMGVANTVLMSALERTREVGTMMALGVRRGWILVLFLAEAVLLSTAGASAGALLGWGLDALLAQKGLVFGGPMTAGAPLVLRPWVAPGYLLTLVAIAAAGALVAALYPAVRASRLRPVQALAGQ